MFLNNFNILFLDNEWQKKSLNNDARKREFEESETQYESAIFQDYLNKYQKGVLRRTGPM